MFVEDKIGLLIPLPSKDSHLFANIWIKKIKTVEHLIFFYRIVERSILSLIMKKYSDFDAHTTANCCHAIAVLASDLIEETTNCNLFILKDVTHQEIERLKNTCHIPEQLDFSWIPDPIIILAGMHTLNIIKEEDLDRGILTNVKNLRKIEPISMNFAHEVVHNIQRLLSCLVTERYDDFYPITRKINLCGIPMEEWYKYINHSNRRRDVSGHTYVSNVYAVQNVLAYLIIKKKKIAVINDHYSLSGGFQRRYAYIFQPNKTDSFELIESDAINLLSQNEEESLIVFGGCAYTMNYEKTNFQLQSWLKNLPLLLLAGDVLYPHFPKVTSDPTFNSSPIIPNHPELLCLFNYLSKIQGFCCKNPEFYCSTHTFPCSAKEILKILTNTNELEFPLCFIPAKLY